MYYRVSRLFFFYVAFLVFCISSYRLTSVLTPLPPSSPPPTLPSPLMTSSHFVFVLNNHQPTVSHLFLSFSIVFLFLLLIRCMRSSPLSSFLIFVITFLLILLLPLPSPSFSTCWPDQRSAVPLHIVSSHGGTHS